MLLSELEPGQSAIILKVLGHGAFRRRIMEMGFVRGKSVEVLLDAPLHDPVKYKVMGYEVSLRLSEAAMIEVITREEAEQRIETSAAEGARLHDSVEHVIQSSKKHINIALVGNPNSGKTSLFNAASGSHEHVGNYGGVTVDVKRGRFSHKGYRITIFDLPGTYSLSAYSPEELYVRRHLVSNPPDVTVNVVAASNLERNLFLTTELIDMDCTMVMALNMYDELEESGAQLDYQLLGEMLGVPVVPTVSRTGKGLDRLFDTIIDVYENRSPVSRHIQITYQPEVEGGISALQNAMSVDEGVTKHFSPRYLATRLLEGDREIERMLSAEEQYPRWIELRDREAAEIKHRLGEDPETAITDGKYGFIAGALRETFTEGESEKVRTTSVIDAFVTHKLFGFPIFLLLMWLMFEATFSLGSYPMEWIEQGVAWLGGAVRRTMQDGMLKDLLVDGVIGGVGGVIVFLPNILILYLFISFMEDSGYMARAAFIMDKIMHRIGLHGKSFIPLIMGFGCNVPAIMATRSIESRSSRIITILINPFMSCSARLPVFVLLVGAFFPKNGGLVMMSLYLLGIVVAVITAKLLRKFMFKRDETPFVMELPPYRIPTLRSTLNHMWEKAAQYLRKMGGIILVASIIVWFLSYFPRTETQGQAYDGVALAAAVGGEAAATDAVAAGTAATEIGAADVPDTETVSPERGAADVPDTETVSPERGAAALDTTGEPDNAVEQPDAETLQRYEQQANSYIGRLGRFFTPVMRPLGFDWRESVALITGMAAKELIVSTLGVLYADSGEGEDTAALAEKLKAPDPVTGKPGMTPLSAMSFLVFVLLYFPCIAAMVAISKETGSWRWTLFSFVYNTGVAWIAAWLVFNIGSLFL